MSDLIATIENKLQVLKQYADLSPTSDLYKAISEVNQFWSKCEYVNLLGHIERLIVKVETDANEILLLSILKDLQDLIERPDLDDKNPNYKIYEAYHLTTLLEQLAGRALEDGQEMNLNAESFCVVMGLIADLTNPKQISGH